MYHCMTPFTTLLTSPLEQFEVSPIIVVDVPLLGLSSVTNLGLYAIITLVLSLAIHFVSIRDSSERMILTSRWNLGIESSFASIHGMVKDQIGSSNERYLPLIYSLFWMIIISNLIGNVAYSFALGTSAIVSLGLSFTIFLGVTLLGLNKHGVHFFSYFIPSGTPLILVPVLSLVELISYVARAFSLGIRLFANLAAGHTLLKILSSFLYKGLCAGPVLFLVSLVPMLLFTALIGLEIAVSVIQSYVFCILACIYIKDAIELH